MCDEVEACRARDAAGRASQDEAEDAGADAARRAAPGLRRTGDPAPG